MAQLAPRLLRLRIRTRRRKPKPPVYWLVVVLLCYTAYKVLDLVQSFVVTLNVFYAVYALTYVVLAAIFRVLLRMIDPEDDLPLAFARLTLGLLLVTAGVLSIVGAIIFMVEVAML